MDELLTNIIWQEFTQDSDIIENRQRMTESYLQDRRVASDCMEGKMNWRAEVDDSFDNFFFFNS